jgi:hypothetical protein
MRELELGKVNHALVVPAKASKQSKTGEAGAEHWESHRKVQKFVIFGLADIEACPVAPSEFQSHVSLRGFHYGVLCPNLSAQAGSASGQRYSSSPPSETMRKALALGGQAGDCATPFMLSRTVPTDEELRRIECNTSGAPPFRRNTSTLSFKGSPLRWYAATFVTDQGIEMYGWPDRH